MWLKKVITFKDFLLRIIWIVKLFIIINISRKIYQKAYLIIDNNFPNIIYENIIMDYCDGLKKYILLKNIY